MPDTLRSWSVRKSTRQDAEPALRSFIDFCENVRLGNFASYVEQFGRGNAFRTTLDQHPLHSWASKTNLSPWSVPGSKFTNDFTAEDIGLESCTLGTALPALVQMLEKHTTVLVQASTGSGKTALAPAVVAQYLWKTRSLPAKHSGMRVIHTVPTAEAMQFVGNFLHHLYAKKSIVIGHYRDSPAPFKSEIPESCHYMYMTPYYGPVTIAGMDVKIDVVVLDELHEITPAMCQYLSIVRMMLHAGSIKRVLLLSATVQQWFADRLENYFTRTSDEFKFDFSRFEQFECTPHPITIVPFCNPISEAYCARREVDYPSMDKPNIRVLRERAVDTCWNLARRSQGGDGQLVFFGGRSDTILAYAAFKRRMQASPAHLTAHIELLLVNGDSRESLRLLSRPPADPATHRVVMTNPVSAVGLTPHGIEHVVDTGVLATPTPPNRRRIYSLDLQFQDQSSSEQRKGRIGRLGAGSYHALLSNQRCTKIRNKDCLADRLTMSYLDSDLPLLINSQVKPLIEPSIPVLLELVACSGIAGFVDCDSRSTAESAAPTIRLATTRGYSDSSLYRMTFLAEALAKAFPSIPLDNALFLVVSSFYGVAVPAVVHVSHTLNQLNGFRRPLAGTIQGRDNPEMVSNSFSQWSGYYTKSDVVHDSVKLMNALATQTGFGLKKCMPAGWKDGSGRATARFPSSFCKAMNLENLQNIWATCETLAINLARLRLFCNADSVFDSEQAGLELYQTPDNRYRLLHITRHTEAMLGLAYIQTQSRVLMFSRESRTTINPKALRTIFTVDAETPAAGSNDVQGERNHQSPAGSLAVYNEIFVPKEGERMVTPFHPADPVEWLLHGNVTGFRNDSLTKSKSEWLHYAIHTNSWTTVFRFPPEDSRLVRCIRQYRRLQSAMIEACLRKEEELPLFPPEEFRRNMKAFLVKFDYKRAFHVLPDAFDKVKYGYNSGVFRLHSRLEFVPEESRAKWAKKFEQFELFDLLEDYRALSEEVRRA